MFDYQQARRFYDRLGPRQETQAFYEEPALRVLMRQGRFQQAASVLEFGCGTGSFAERLLSDWLPPGAQYRGLDLSRTMIRLSRQRLARFEPRVELELSAGPPHLPAADGSLDRVVSNYVLDLLSVEDILLFLTEARRVLSRRGRLCTVNLTWGPGFPAGAISRLWSRLQRLSPGLVGGCRPLDLRSFLPEQHWRIQTERVEVAWGLASQVIVAAPVSLQPRSGAIGSDLDRRRNPLKQDPGNVRHPGSLPDRTDPSLATHDCRPRVPPRNRR